MDEQMCDECHHFFKTKPIFVEFMEAVVGPQGS